MYIYINMLYMYTHIFVYMYMYIQANRLRRGGGAEGVDILAVDTHSS